MPEYVILQKRTISFPQGEVSATSGPAAEAAAGPRVETWVPLLVRDLPDELKVRTPGNDTDVARILGDDQEDAIEAYAGTDEDLKHPGQYKAVAWPNWAGAVTLRPKTTTDKSRTLDE